eukprot:1138679-Pelagomonas_calceolata.AAC.1
MKKSIHICVQNTPGAPYVELPVHSIKMQLLHFELDYLHEQKGFPRKTLGNWFQASSVVFVQYVSAETAVQQERLQFNRSANG